LVRQALAFDEAAKTAAYEADVPRLYTRFPNRAPGIGLLLLRVATGLTLIAHASFIVQTQDVGIVAVAMGLLAFLSGLALLAGFLTPVASILALIIIAGTGLCWFPAFNGGVIAGNHLSLDVAVMAAAAALLGPGAFSVDALMFGRRKIIIPSASPSQRA
jgi:uncharacterized membrane protein YphA (DoxX/SURF4 family)